MSVHLSKGLAERIKEATEYLRRDPQRSLQAVAEIDVEQIDVPSALEVLSIRSRANIHLGDYASGEPNALRAIEMASSHGYRVQEGLARNEAGVYRFVRGEFTDALNLYAAAEQILRDLDEPGRGRVFVNIANVYNFRGDYLQALLAYEQALSIASATGDALTKAKVYSNMSGLYRSALGSSAVAGEYVRQASELYTEMGDQVGLAKCLVNQAGLLIDTQDFAEAEACYRRSLQIREAFSEPDDHIMTFDGLISVLLKQGKIDEAEQVYSQAVDQLSNRQMTRRGGPFLRMAESRILAARGQVAEAVVIAEEVHTFLVEYGQLEFANDLSYMIAESYDVLGRHQEAAALYKQLLTQKDREARQQADHRMSVIRAQMDRITGADDPNSADHLTMIPTQERLSRAEANNEEFIAVLAHELKSPLHTIRSVMSLLANADAVSKEERQEYGREMQQMATRMIDQITATLATAQRRTTNLSPVVNARTVWEHVLSAAKQGSAFKQVSLAWSFDRAEYPIRTDEQMLVTILENLVSNAVKFSGEGSSVTVTVSVPPAVDDQPRLMLEVVDHGPGLSKEDLALLFRPFQTLSARPTGKEGSSGLGLFLVRRTVEALHGLVWGENRGNGAVFTVELPLVEPNVAAL